MASMARIWVEWGTSHWFLYVSPLYPLFAVRGITVPGPPSARDIQRLHVGDLISVR